MPVANQRVDPYADLHHLTGHPVTQVPRPVSPWCQSPSGSWQDPAKR
jgi:hypothetical protein